MSGGVDILEAPLAALGLRPREALNREAQAALYARVGPLILHRCRRILGGGPDAEDAFHDIFVKITKSWPKYDSRRALLPWILRITTHHCIDALRSHRNRTTPKIPEIADAGRGHDVEYLHTVRTLLQGQGRSAQEVVIYHYVDGFSVRQVAKMMAISERTVSRRLRSFEAAAQARLAEEKDT